MPIKTSFISTVLVLACSTAAVAQASPNDPKPSLVEQSGDWSIRCFPVRSQSPCDMYQELRDKDIHQRILSTSIAYVATNGSYAIQISTPIGVHIPSGVIIKSDAYTSPTLHYRRCDPNGCYVEGMAPRDLIDGLSRAGADATVNVLSYPGMHGKGKSYALQLHLKGFSAALERMMQLAKRKATSAK